jgi:DNA (cytosine-5)-methyltransferase 1
VKKINRKLKKRDGKYPSISIFSGILGIELGLERAGFSTVFASDFDKHCKDVIEDNRDVFGEFPYLCEDITKLSPERILELSGLKPGEAAMLAGGPPCQPFSKSGLRKGGADDKGQLFKRYLDYLQVIKPRAFILENVRGMVSSNKGEDFRNILEHFDETGYTIYWKILDAANHGVPEFRQRLFIVGFRDRIRFSYPEIEHSNPDEPQSSLLDKPPYVTVGEALEGLPENVKGPLLSGKYSHLLADIPEGMNYSHYTERRGHPDPLFEWRSKFWYFLLKTDRSKPSLTIQAYPGNNTGPFHWENRRMAVQEIQRIQSFPDWLKINKPYMAGHRLVGNAVPPLLAESVGIQIKKALDEHVLISTDEYLEGRESALKNHLRVASGRGSGKSLAKKKAAITAG